jgi:hypothetical protein
MWGRKADLHVFYGFKVTDKRWTRQSKIAMGIGIVITFPGFATADDVVLERAWPRWLPGLMDCHFLSGSISIIDTTSSLFELINSSTAFWKKWGLL